MPLEPYDTKVGFGGMTSKIPRREYVPLRRPGFAGITGRTRTIEFTQRTIGFKGLTTPIVLVGFPGIMHDTRR